MPRVECAVGKDLREVDLTQRTAKRGRPRRWRDKLNAHEILAYRGVKSR